MIPTTTAPVRVTRLRKLPASVDQATLTLAGSSAALPVSARYSDFVRAPMGPIERSAGHGGWKLEVSASLDVGESWNLGVFLAHALKAHSRLQEKQSDVPDQPVQTVWATGAVDVIDLRVLPVGHIETKLRQALGATPVPKLFLLPPDNLCDVPAELRAELEARGTRIIAPATMAEALEALDLPPDWAKEAAPDLAGWRGDPYRGLEAYQAEHRPIFFGRANAQAEALERLRTRAERGTSLLVIHGKSGVGKSSLAMAGLLDDVVEQVPARAPFGTAIIRFGDGATPLAALRAGFAQVLGLEDISALEASSATEWLGTWPEHTEPRTVLLILDQLEQGLLADEADTIAFGEALSTLVRTDRVWVIATLRSDRIDLLERAPALAEMADGDGLYRLARPTLAELGEIIRAPAKLAGLTFEEGDGLVELLAEEAMRAPDSLPLLQVTLMRLADQRDAEGRVGMRDYERIGGFSGAVGRLADETVREMESDGINADVVDRTLASLVRIDPDTDRVDARVVDPDAQTAEVQQVLSALVEARLATASTVSEALDPDTDSGSVGSTGQNDSGRRVRLAHETLIREWPRLHDLAARLRTELSLRDRLEDDALRWDQDGRPTGDLIRNTARLTAAEALVADALATPSQQAQTYVEASRAEVERQAEQRRAAETLEQRTRTRRRITTVAALVAVVILGLTGFAINQAQQTRAAQELAELQVEAIEQAEQAAEQERVLAQAAEDAQRRAEDQLNQTQRNQTLFLIEAARTLIEDEPGQAKALLAEIPADPETLLDWNIHDDFSEVLNLASIHDREIKRFVSWERIRGISVSSDGLNLVTASPDHIARIWDVVTGESRIALHGHEEYVSAAAFSPDGSLVVTGSRDHTARIWDVATGKAIFTLLGHLQDINAVTFSPDGTRIATGSSDYTTRIWDSATGEMLATLRGQNAVINSAEFSPDGSKLATSASDGSVHIWDLSSGGVIKVLVANNHSVRSIAFSSDGSKLVAGAKDDTVRVWDLTTGDILVTLRGHRGFVNSVAFSPDGRRVVTGSDDQTVRVWDVRTGEVVVQLRGHEDRVTSVVFLSNGTQIASGSWDRTARIWDVSRATKIATLQGHEMVVSSVATSPDGNHVATGSWDHTARVWDIATGQTKMTFRGHRSNLSAIDFSPDGTRLVTGSWDQTARVWDVTTGETQIELRGHEDGVTSARFSPDGTRLVTGSWDHTARMWDVTTGQTILTFRGHDHSVNSVAFSRDGIRLVTASGDRTVRVWDAETGNLLYSLHGHEGVVNSASFSPNGNYVASGSQDRTVRIWDLATGETLLTLHGHEKDVNWVEFSPDGNRVISTSEDTTARIWDVATGETLLELKGHRDDVIAAAFTLDGRRVVTGSYDATSLIWDVGTQSIDQLTALSSLSNFEPLDEALRIQFSLNIDSSRLSSPRSKEILLAARDAFSSIERQYTVQDSGALLAAASAGSPQAHQELSNIKLTEHADIEQDLEAALFHAAIATSIFEVLGDEEAAAPMRIRRANLARSLPPETVAALWPRIRDWRPQIEE